MAKRLMDILVSSVLLIFFLPVMALIAFLILLTMGRPILFKQERLGYMERPFTLLKFRTMRNAYAGDGRPLPDAERLTRLGAFLRRTSLDELSLTRFGGHKRLVSERCPSMRFKHAANASTIPT
jgi:lipopolysaccharide/colanic/teichoic acid biosynthesis glycosyltransferase